MLLFEYQLFLNTLNIYIFIKIFIYQDYFLITKKYKFFNVIYVKFYNLNYIYK